MGQMGIADRSLAVRKNPTFLRRPGIKIMVARTRFELVISALRGRRPKPLDERAISLSRKEVVARTRFELVISALRGRRPKPLDERAT